MIAMLAFSSETFALVAGCLLERRCPIIVGVAMKTLLVFACLVAPAAAADYDPLLVDDAKIEKVELTVKDAKRSRELPILIYLPKDKKPAAVVLCSHGLGGTRKVCAYLGEHWAKRGYVGVFLQHPGSDDSVWKDTPIAQRMAAMKEAAGFDNFMLRVADVPIVLDQLEQWNGSKDHALSGRMDLKHIGMSGHSFGANTTQAVSGQSYPIGKGFTDLRIKAAAMMSPAVPARGDAAKSFGNVKIPWLLLTGTHDTSPIGEADMKARLAVYPALPTGDKFELVLDKAEHSAFTEVPLPGEKEKRNPNHHKAILAVTTAFWDAYLRDDAAAKSWIAGDKVRGVLEKADRWQTK